MKSNIIKISLGLAIVALGTCLIKKKGLLEDDLSAYEAFEAQNN